MKHLSYKLFSIFLLAIVIPLMSSVSVSQTEPIQFVGRNVSLTHACSYYRIYSTDVKKDLKTFDISKIKEVHGKLNEIWIEALVNESYDVTVPVIGTCNKLLQLNETYENPEEIGCTVYNSTHYNCSYSCVVGYTTETRYRNDWKLYKAYTIDKGELKLKEEKDFTKEKFPKVNDWYDVRVCGKYNFETTSSGFTVSIDHTPSYLNVEYLGYDWWNASWGYRKPITITEQSNSDLNDYPVHINVSYDSDMNSDFSDLRFTYYNSTDGTETEIQYWIEQKVDSSWAYVWLKVPYIPASGTSTVYMYYGNPDATVKGSPTNIFNWYEDFEDGSYSGWRVYSASGGTIYGVETVDGRKVLHTHTTGVGQCIYYTSTTFGRNLMIEAYLKTMNNYVGLGFHGQDHYNFYLSRGYGNYRLMLIHDGSREWSVGGANKPGGYWYLYKVWFDGSIIYADIDGSTVSKSDSTFTSGYVGICSWGSETDEYLDWIRARKYTDPEPTYEIGEEETPIVNQPPFVDKPKTFDDSYVETGNFTQNSKVIIRVNVTDPDGAEDIDKVLITIIDNSSTVQVNNATMSSVSSITNGYIYEYNYTIPTDGPKGLWTINVYANDTQNAWDYNTTIINIGKIYIDKCSVLDKEGFTYILTTDIVDSSSSTCMDIQANNIVLDCQNHKIDGKLTSGTYGIYANGVHGIKIRNCIVSEWGDGIRFENSYGNEIENITGQNSEDYGINFVNVNDTVVRNFSSTDRYIGFGISNANNLTLTGLDLRNYYYGNSHCMVASELTNSLINDTYGNTYTGTGGDCIILNSGSGNTLSYITVDSYYVGIRWGISNSIGYNLTINSAYDDGFDIGGNNNEIYYSSITGDAGIWIEGNNSVIHDSTITAKYYSGVSFAGSNNTVYNSKIIAQSNADNPFEIYGDMARYNKIYNNYIINDAGGKDVAFSTTFYENYWNTTKQFGTRIYSSGPLIGGNYWSNSAGSGFSDTCTDADQDGFCDSPYDLVSGTTCTIGVDCSNNVDYLALSDEYVPDTIPPTYSLNSTNSTIVGTPVLHSLKWTDNRGLSGYIFSFDNCTGTFVNDTWVAWSGVPTEAWSNVTKVINDTVGCTIRWKVYANDTSNNWAVSDTYSYTTYNPYLTDCAVLDQEGATYYLTKDIIDSSASICMNILANNIVLDCQGHTIDGDDWNGEHGIYVNRDSPTTTNITIKNCVLSDWYNANIYLYQANGNQIENVTSTSAPGNGIFIGSSSNNRIVNCTVIDNSINGIYLDMSSNNEIVNCTLKDNHNADFHNYAETEAQCNNYLENVIGSNNLPIKYYNYSVTIENEVLSELILCNADYSNITNVTIVSSPSIANNYVYVRMTDYSNFTQINSSNNFYGIVLSSSSNNQIVDSTFNANTFDGIWILSSGNNRIVNCTSSGNFDDGISFESSSNNQIVDSSISSNAFGIYLYMSSNNTIHSNRIENNDYYGVYIEDSGSTPNKFYNNLFNNIDNVYFDGTIYHNYWNTTRQTGDRIYSPGIEIGGNYWTNPNGNGYSDTCTDADQDGFCDDPYTLATDNIDYLPLSDEYVPDTTPPTITFVSQTPSDINSINVYGDGLNITYSITDDSGVDTITLYYKTNSSTTDTLLYINGTAYSGFRSTTSYTLSGSNYIFSLTPDEIYPGTYNIKPYDMATATHYFYTLSSNNQMIKIRFLNVSNHREYNTLAIYAINQTPTSRDLRFYYCNESYTSGNPGSSQYCTNFFTLPADTPYVSYPIGDVTYYLIPLGINTTTGMIGDVKVTETSYIILRGPTNGDGWDIGYVSQVTRDDTIQTSSNIGSTWTNFEGTVDAHIHQFDGTDSLWYYVCANDTLGNSGCSSTRQDLMDLYGLPPTAPDVHSPTNKTYTEPIWINYTEAISPNDYPITTYKITLLNTDFSYVKTIVENNYPHLSYLWDTSNIPHGSYIINVTACDNQNQCSYGLSEVFTILKSYNETGSSSLQIFPIIHTLSNIVQDSKSQIKILHAIRSISSFTQTQVNQIKVGSITKSFVSAVQNVQNQIKILETIRSISSFTQTQVNQIKVGSSVKSIWSTILEVIQKILFKPIIETLLPRNIPPTITEVKEPIDPSLYGQLTEFRFNATICDEDGADSIDTVIFEFNGVNETVASYIDYSPNCRIYYYIIYNLGVGKFNWKWYANDTGGLEAEPYIGTYEVLLRQIPVSGSGPQYTPPTIIEVPIDLIANLTAGRVQGYLNFDYYPKNITIELLPDEKYTLNITVTNLMDRPLAITLITNLTKLYEKEFVFVEPYENISLPVMLEGSTVGGIDKYRILILAQNEYYYNYGRINIKVLTVSKKSVSQPCNRDSECKTDNCAYAEGYMSKVCLPEGEGMSEFRHTIKDIAEYINNNILIRYLLIVCALLVTTFIFLKSKIIIGAFDNIKKKVLRWIRR